LTITLLGGVPTKLIGIKSAAVIVAVAVTIGGIAALRMMDAGFDVNDMDGTNEKKPSGQILPINLKFGYHNGSLYVCDTIVERLSNATMWLEIIFNENHTLCYNLSLSSHRLVISEQELGKTMAVHISQYNSYPIRFRLHLDRITNTSDSLLLYGNNNTIDGFYIYRWQQLPFFYFLSGQVDFSYESENYYKLSHDWYFSIGNNMTLYCTVTQSAY